MADRTKFGFKLLLVMVLIAFTFIIAPFTLVAAPECGQTGIDDECDGFKNADEDPAILGLSHPQKRDLFIIMVESDSGPGFPANLMEFISASESQSMGLSIATHIISPAQASQIESITTDQNPVKVRELDNTPPSGYSSREPPLVGVNTGLINDDNAENQIYVTAIQQYIVFLCDGDAANCEDGSGTLSGQNLINLYINYVVAHEVGHSLSLAWGISAQDQDKYNGMHYSPRDEVVMSQYATFKKGVFYIPVTFTPDSRNYYILHDY